MSIEPRFLRRFTNLQKFALLLTLLLGGCAASAVAVVLLAGVYLGQLAVSFPPNNPQAARSDNSGQVRLGFEDDGGQGQLRSYEGILPGFSDLGSTQARLDLMSGAIEGTVTDPEGGVHDLAEILPGLQVTPLGDADTANTGTREFANRGFELSFADPSQDIDYTYRMELGGRLDDAGAELDGDVEVYRRLSVGDDVQLDDRGTGIVEAGRIEGAEAEQPSPLEPLASPIFLEAQPEVMIAAGESVQLEPTVRGGQELSYQWSPSTGLDDPQSRSPLATPEQTTIYTLTVTGADGQTATISTTVTVETSSEPECTTDGDCGAGEICVDGGCEPAPPECQGDSDCSDDVFCNGSEVCEDGVCGEGAAPCGLLQVCDEESDACVTPSVTLANSGLRASPLSEAEMSDCAFAAEAGDQRSFLAAPDEAVVYYAQWELSLPLEFVVQTVWYDSVGAVVYTSPSETRQEASGCIWVRQDLEPGSYRVALEAGGEELDSIEFEVQDGLPADAIGTIRGSVMDADTGLPIVGAVVRIDRSSDAPVVSVTDVDGVYELFAPNVSDHFIVTASRDAYIPSAESVESATLQGTTLVIDFDLPPLRSDRVVIEAVPEVHHLGDGSFTGSANSQFQKDAEGTAYLRTLTIDASQLPPNYQTAELVLLAKGMEHDNEAWVNGSLLAPLCCSPADGGYAEMIVAIPMELLVSGSNELRIEAYVESPGGYDDFEFVNAQVWLHE